MLAKNAPLMALAVLALTSNPAAVQADERPPWLTCLVLYRPDFWKGAETAPPIERRLPATAGRAAWANVPDSTVLTVRLVAIDGAGNDTGWSVRYEYTPAGATTCPPTRTTTRRTTRFTSPGSGYGS